MLSPTAKGIPPLPLNPTVGFPVKPLMPALTLPGQAPRPALSLDKNDNHESSWDMYVKLLRLNPFS